MTQQASRYREIIIRVVPTPMSAASVLQRGPGRAGADETRSYDVLIYTDLALPALDQASGRTLPPGQPSEIADLPLASVEQIVIRWGSYEDYLAAFFEGGKDPTQMRSRLIETLSPGLEALFGGPAPTDAPVRVWADSEALELVELPWELVTAPTDEALRWFAFVRGLPPEPSPPLLPLAGPLRLAVVCTHETRPDLLLERMRAVPGIEIIEYITSPREALQQIASAGIELVHIIADGYPTLAYDSVLYFHGEATPELPAVELSGLLRGSRVAVLGMTSARTINPDLLQISHRQVPAVYRAFAYLGGSDLPLPSMVVPLGPTEDGRLGAFWGGFYAALSETLSVEDAMARGRDVSIGPGEIPPTPMALFLRHRHGRLFRRDAARHSHGSREAPSQLYNEFEISKALVSRLNATIKAQPGAAPEGALEFLASEPAHQDRLLADLEPWTTLEAGEE